jgi:hypothetical protein
VEAAGVVVAGWAGEAGAGLAVLAVGAIGAEGGMAAAETDGVTVPGAGVAAAGTVAVFGDGSTGIEGGLAPSAAKLAPVKLVRSRAIGKARDFMAKSGDKVASKGGPSRGDRVKGETDAQRRNAGAFRYEED